MMAVRAQKLWADPPSSRVGDWSDQGEDLAGGLELDDEEARRTVLSRLLYGWRCGWL